MSEYPANVHRGLHALSERATAAFEGARASVAQFIGARQPEEIVFTRGTTESINLVCQAWGRSHLKAGDEVIVSLLEHHSNLVPWQMLARELGIVLKYADITHTGRLDFVSLAHQFTNRTHLVAITGMSNVLGTIPPLAEIIGLAHEHGAWVMLDAAQSVVHQPLNVAELGADFVAFSGHKLGGPTGVGVLHARLDLLEAMPPWMGGGSMVVRVDRNASEWNEPPWKFEAGTPPIAEVIGLGAALDFLRQYNALEVLAHERKLTARAHRLLEELGGVTILGPEPQAKGPIVAFKVEGVHPHDLAQWLDRHGVAIRAGHHCVMPLHRRLGVAASARASFFLYNTDADVDRLVEAVADAQRRFRRRAGATALSAPGGSTL